MTDRDAIALTIYGEARGETTEGRLAVACVLKNRMKLGKWGTRYEDVVRAKFQFSCWNENDPNLPILLKKLAESEAGLPITDAVLRECYWIADGLLTNSFTPQVQTATHYFATWLDHPPTWAKSGQFVATIGSHVFYRNVA